MRRIGLALALAGIVAGTSGRAVAIQPLEPFYATGTFADSATLGGSLLIGLDSGTVINADLTVAVPGSSLLTFTDLVPASTGTIGSSYEISLLNTTQQYYLDLYLPTPTLVGYTGGPIESTSDTTGGFLSSYGPGDPDLTSGSLSTSAVPEPSSLVLAGIAATVGLGLMARRRRRA
jgi:hypothetical protein